MCEETYLEMKKARAAILDVCMSLYRENTKDYDGSLDIEERMVSLLRVYDNIVGDYVMKENR